MNGGFRLKYCVGVGMFLLVVVLVGFLLCLDWVKYYILLSVVLVVSIVIRVVIRSGLCGLVVLFFLVDFLVLLVVVVMGGSFIGLFFGYM